MNVVAFNQSVYLVAAFKERRKWADLVVLPTYVFAMRLHHSLNFAGKINITIAEMCWSYANLSEC